MKKFRVLISLIARKQLISFEKSTITRIKKSLQKLADDPHKGRSGVDIKGLVGTKNPQLFRLRIGDYRAIYAIIGNDVKVTEIIHRKNAYKFLD